MRSYPLAIVFSALIVLGTLGPKQPAFANLPLCSSASSDPDGDGYGWENASSCQVPAADGVTDDSNSNSNSNSNSADCIDTAPFDDDWGWDGSQSCRLSASSQTPANDSAPATGDAACVDSPPYDDQWGWNGSASCLLSSSAAGAGNSDSASSVGGSADGNTGSNGVCVDSAPFDDDWGWDGTQSCLLSGSQSAATPPATTPAEPANDAVAASGTRITSSLTPIRFTPANTCLTRQDALNNDYHEPIRLGDFILSTNAWNFGVAGNFDWQQCIYANQNGAVAGWNYVWGAGGGPSDYNVRSYPELIYGVKSQGEISADKSVTGLPVRIDQMPSITVNYSLASTEYGPTRAVSASTNPRFPNGTLIQGERNIAIESFLHPADSAGNCGPEVVQRGSNASNHSYEVMVWLDSGAERLPSGPGDFVTTITLTGQQYDVYTKSSDRKYVAFVARNPQLTGVLDWSGFVNWARTHAHRVREDFGARINSVQIQDDWCLANLLIGTEIWWGDGDFNIYEWQINQTR